MTNPKTVSSSPDARVSAMYDTVLILDFGSQYSHLITRRIRELGIYCEMLACNTPLADILAFQPKGIVLSGGPYSVYDADAPRLDPEFWASVGVPVLGICYGLQEIARSLGGKVSPCEKREYGHAALTISHTDSIFAGFSLNENVDIEVVPESAASSGNKELSMLGEIKEIKEIKEINATVGQATVWMSHGDQLSAPPAGFRVIASTQSAPFAAIDNPEKRIYGIQFHPEVTHSKRGKEILKNFVVGICKCTPSWSMDSFIEMELARIRALVGPNSHVIGAVSGGVDSTVAAVLMTKAIGDRFHAVLVDNGVMRLNECAIVKKTLKDQLGINLTVSDAADEFLSKLKGVTDPEKKRKIIGNTFIHVFERESEIIEKKLEIKYGANTRKIEFLLQGTLYPDVIESISFKGPSATIKTHHNVGGLLDTMRLKLIEPLRELFKDEVRKLGQVLGIHEDLVWRHPFPGPGIAIRILGEVTRPQIDIVQQADFIFIEEIKKAGLYRKISQAYAALLPIRSVGVMGDNRTYEQVIALRAVESTDFMTADWFEMPYDVLKRISSRIINEVKGVNRCVYDVSSKPPSTIEWE